ncbi:MAG: tRNA (adenosine(37)-N6)-dimethylallyltransferase MiaA [Lachnospiraceae bacterium]|nr:tRNA (adenosine(37)-N6)-dimethylallyltransferase MiaA [Lachnospiraceae bacterium]
MKEKKPLVVLTGPTAVGKTDLSIELAKRINGEMISADSMQVYRGMDIGTAKIMPNEMQGIKHYLIDILDPDEEFDVSLFKRLSMEACDDILKNGKLPIVVGGTGFYIQALLKNVDFSEGSGSDEEYRKELSDKLANEGVDALYDMLKTVDPEACLTIHKNNTKRVIRALEYHHLTGEKISEHNKRESEKESPFNYAYFVLNNDRDILYERIDKRIDIMMEQGLLEEVKALHEKGYKRGMVSMEGLGYKEILQYLDGEISLYEAIYILKRDTRHFAKRQLTWFRREKDVIMIDKQKYKDDEAILEYMLSVLREKKIIK